MGQQNSAQSNKFQYVDTNEAQQRSYSPIVSKTSLQPQRQRNSTAYQGPVQGQQGEFTGLQQFLVPKKYRERLKKNALNFPKPQSPIQGKGIFPPFMYRKSLNVYYGQWLKGKPHGYGQIVNDKGFYYQGWFQQGLPSYYGVYMTSDQQYRGQIKYGRAEGKGKYQDGQRYVEGVFKDNFPFSNCIQRGAGYTFQGNYSNGKWSQGKLAFNLNTSTYSGQFLNGYMHGNGILKTTQYKYQGTFVDGMKSGKGKLIWASGQTYQGQFLHDQITGFGEFTQKNSINYKGQFLNGRAQGSGMIIDGRQNISAIWKNGEAVGLN